MTSTETKPRPIYQIDDLQRRTVAALNAAGLPFHHPEHACGRAELTVPGARWQLVAMDSAEIDLTRIPDDDAVTDPHRLADLAATLLTGVPRRARRHPHAAGRCLCHTTTVVARDLTASGFTVELTAHVDKQFFTVCGEIEVSVPGARDGGKVNVYNQGWLSWTHDYWNEHAVVDPNRPDRGMLADPDALATTIAARIALVIAEIREP